MSVAPAIPTALLCSLMLLPACGCQQQSEGLSEAEKADIRDSWLPRSQQVVQPGSTELAEGTAPMVYQVPTAGNVQVTDASTGNPLAIAAVPHGTIIRIDAEKGIFAGERQLRAGPLPAGQRYGIVLSVPQGTRWQSRVEASHPTLNPATHPANEKSGSTF